MKETKEQETQRLLNEIKEIKQAASEFKQEENEFFLCYTKDGKSWAECAGPELYPASKKVFQWDLSTTGLTDEQLKTEIQKFLVSRDELAEELFN